MAMAVFREAMGPLSLAGLPVASLCFPVNPESPLAAALLRTVCLAPPTPAAHEEPHAAEAAVNLDKKQSGLQRLHTVRSRGKKNEVFGASDCLRSSSLKPEAATSGFSSFLSFQLFGESTKKALLLA